VLIGRAAELEACLRSIEEGRPIALVADAGMGKTSLLAEAADACHRPASIGHGLVTLSWKAYLPLETALGRPIGARDTASAARSVADHVGNGLLVIDDVQWADVETVRVLVLLASRVRLALAVRSEDPAASHTMAKLDAAGFQAIALPPLTAGESRALLRSARPGLDPALARDIAAQANGSPLLLEQLSWGGEPSATLRISVEARLHRLPPDPRRTLGFMALLGRPVDPDTVGPGVEQLVAMGLVAHTADGLVPRHGLLAEAAAARLTTEERHELHAAIASTTADPGEAAVHLDLVGDRTAARKSAVLAASTTDHAGQRARLLLIALRNGDGGAEDDQLRLRAADALVHAGEYREAGRVAADVRSSDPEVVAESLLYRARAARGTTGLVAARGFVRRGLEVAGNGSRSSVVARLLLEDVTIANWEWRPDIAVPRARTALAMARNTGHLAEAMHALGTALSSEGARDAVVYLRLAADRARRERKTTVAFEAAFSLVTAMKLTKNWKASLPMAEAYRRSAIEAGLRSWDVMFRWHEMATCLDCAGDMERVVEIGEGLLGDVAIPARLVGDTIGSVAIAHMERGRVDVARELLQRSPRSEQESIYPYAAWADLYVTDADPSSAIDVVTEAAERFPEDPNLMTLWVIRGWADLQLGREPPPYRGTRHVSAEGYLRAMRAQIELARGQTGAAERSFAVAAEMIRDFDIRAELRFQWAAGVAAGRSGALDRSREYWLGIERTASDLGFAHVLSKVHASLRSVGVRRSAARTKGPGTLTGRERDILHLIARGLRTRTIASRLGVEPATVDDIVRTATRKLDARTRIEAAARLAELERVAEGSRGAVAS
jgi:DNA-binding CsgD family transcriptional regulator/tetratricopeptide (TPR) repeat protein